MKNNDSIPHYFIAIPFDAETKVWLQDKQLKLKQQLHYCYQNWVEIEDFHLTLTFLGAINEDQLEQLNKLIQSERLTSAFELTIGELGFFGLTNRPRVAWIDVEHKFELFSLHSSLQDLMLKIDQPIDKRRYCPHITLAKKWKGLEVRSSEIDLLKKQLNKQRRVNVNRVVLYKICLGKRPKYREMLSWSLEG